MPFRCHSSDKRHDELLDAAYNRLERNGLDVELVLPDEGSPLALLGFVLKERSRERSWRCGREPGLAPLECPHDRFREDLSLE